MAALNSEPTSWVMTDLKGWGRTVPIHGDLCELRQGEMLHEVFGTAHPGVIARGMGRSYGDAAQCSGGLTVDVTELSALGVIDSATATITVDAGASLHDLMQWILPQGWFVPVTPGTRYVTVGGAIAADVHGKNHHRDGSFARHVTEMTVCTPTGIHVVSPERDSELFWATAGGMGLTGIIVSATLRLIPVESSWMQVESRRFKTLSGLMSEMTNTDDRHRYSVAWLDCTRRVAGDVRSLLSRGNHALASELPRNLRSRRLEVPGKPVIAVPRGAPRWLLNRVTANTFNESWFRVAAPESQQVRSIGQFFHPLDAIADWNLLYGKRGFVQYQFVVPPDRCDLIEDVAGSILDAGVPSFLGVLKRLGPGTPGPLSFSQEGWTMALDFPVGPRRLPALLDGLDEVVAEAGGRVYLAKDSRLRPELLHLMYPLVADLATVRRRVDPEGRLTSDLDRRLGLPR